MTILVTGAAGFIGYHVTSALLDQGEAVIGLDNLNSYYDVALKRARLARLSAAPGFTFLELDVGDHDAVHRALAGSRDAITHIVHLSAQAGVRYSLENPFSYLASNVTGHLVMLELARSMPHLSHLVYASSSSVYGANAAVPFDEGDRVDAPLSLYAATKRADELMSHAYSHLFDIPQTGLRFFTVYGPWGRPDMAYYAFAKAIAQGRPITLYDDGALKRDFTYIDDIVSGVVACMRTPPPVPGPQRILNIGNSRAEPVALLVALLEEGLGRKASIRSVPRPKTDVPETFASVDRIEALTGFQPSTPLSAGIPRFVAWFKSFHT
jgi:UDP-glucuronate 4-epimerase